MFWVAVFVALLWVGLGLDIVARRSALGLTVATFAAVGWFVSAPESHADNTRLESSTNALVVASPSTMEFEKLHRGSQNPRHRSNTRPVGWSQP